MPTLAFFTPTAVTAGGTDFTLTVNGFNFVSSSTVLWNGSPRITTFVSNTEITAKITAADISVGGTSQIAVNNPPPGGGTTASANFFVNNPLPSITSISQTSVLLGSPQFTLTVNGSNFVTTSTVLWNYSSLQTTYISSTQLTAIVPASDIAVVQPVSISVANPAPGGGDANPLNFTITTPVPAITSISPPNSPAGSLDLTLTVNGSNFVQGYSVVNWNGSARDTNYVNSGQLTALIQQSDVATAGTGQVTVLNRQGGGTSNTLTFTILPPQPTITSVDPVNTIAGQSGFKLNLSGFDFTSGSVVQWNGSPRTTSFQSAFGLTADILSSDISSAGSFPVTVSTPGFNLSNPVNFTVYATAPLPITTNELPPTANGKTYYFQLATTRGISPQGGAVTWSISSGALPFGLFLDGSSGLISGTVSGVTSSFTVRVADVTNPQLFGIQDLTIAVTNPGRNDSITACGGSDTATPISNGLLRGSISPYGDVDTYSFTLTQTTANLNIETYAFQGFTYAARPLQQMPDFLDTVMELLDSSCHVIALNDDLDNSQTNHNTDSRITVGPTPFPASPPANPSDIAAPTSLPAGTYYIRIRDYRGDGRPDMPYDLTVSGIQ